MSSSENISGDYAIVCCPRCCADQVSSSLVAWYPSNLPNPRPEILAFIHIMRQILFSMSIIVALSSCVEGVRLKCDYDQFHRQGGQNAPCAYAAVPATTVALAGTNAFVIDGSHLSSLGPMKYIKQTRSMSPTDFLACSTPACTELDVKSGR